MFFSVLFDSQQIQQSCQCSKWGLRVTLVPILFQQSARCELCSQLWIYKINWTILTGQHPCITTDTLVFALPAADNSLSACLSWLLYVLPRRMLRGKTNVINIFTYYPLYKQGVYYRRSKYENSLKKNKIYKEKELQCFLKVTQIFHWLNRRTFVVLVKLLIISNTVCSSAILCVLKHYPLWKSIHTIPFLFFLFFFYY